MFKSRKALIAYVAKTVDARISEGWDNAMTLAFGLAVIRAAEEG